MSRTCTVCTHEDKGQIDLTLTIGKQSLASVAKEYGLSASAVSRHREHLPRKVAEKVRSEEGKERAKEEAQSLDIVKQARYLYALTLETLQKARSEDKSGTLLRAIEVAIKNLGFIGQLMGELDPEGSVNIYVEQNTVLVQQVQAIQKVVMVIADRHPELKAEILAELQEAENE